MTTTFINPPTAAPCPPWCGQPRGHGYEMEELADGAPSRHHAKEYGSSSEGVDLLQRAVWREGGETAASMPAIRVYIGGNSHESDITSPEQARCLAAALLEAADDLEAIA